MNKASNTETENKQKKGGKFLPALCNIIGVLIIAAVILICLPLTVPRLLGYDIYEVLSPSMHPAVPEGSVVIAKPEEPENIQPGDVIVFVRNGANVTHRVVENHVVSGELITKGDANANNDIDPVPYHAVTGKMVFHVPVVGKLMGVLSSTIGKIYLMLFACCGFMFTIVAGRLRRA